MVDEQTDSLTISDRYYNEGLSYYKYGDLEKAKQFYKLAIDSCETVDVYIFIKYYTSLLGIYLSKNEYGDAIAVLNEFETKELKPADIKNIYIKATEQSIFIDSGQLEAALEANIIRYNLSVTSNNKNQKIKSLIDKVMILNELGRSDDANILLDQLLEIKDLSPLQKSSLTTKKGIKKFFEENYVDAIIEYKKSLMFYRDSNLNGKQHGIAMKFANIAEAYIELEKYEESMIYLDSFARINQSKVSNSLRTSVFKYELRLSKGLNISNDRIEKLIDKINEDQEESYRIKFNKELELLTDEKEISEELLKANQQAELDKLEFRNIFIISASVLILIILIALFLIFKQKRDHEIKNLKFQQRLLRSQMNPHFIFNVLSSIQNLIRINPDLAPKFITKFSRLLRRVLENSSQNYVSIMDEVEVIENYLDLQKLRFPELFRYELNIDEELRDDMIHIPPMLIQPFIENALEHGFKGIDYPGVIILNLKLKKSRKKDFLQCVISDNGVGYVEKDNNLKKSMSIKLISDFINKSTGKEIKISFFNTSKKFGTIVEFNIPSK